MPGHRWSRAAPRLTAPPICKKPPQPPLAPLPPLPPWLLCWARLRYNIAEGIWWDVGGLTKLIQAPEDHYIYTGTITRGNTLSITVILSLDPGMLAVELQGDVNHPPTDHAHSAGNAIAPGLAWLITCTNWIPGEPEQLAEAKITT